MPELHHHTVAMYPRTRYMGSKQHLLPILQQVVGQGRGRSALDAFSGSGCVAYMLKCAGYQVISNDYLAYPYVLAHALVENNTVRLASSDIQRLLASNPHVDRFIQDTYGGLYFSDAENAWLDNVMANAWQLSGYKRSLALAALARACVKKRPRGVFTYVGERYNDGRRDLQLTLEEHFLAAIEACNAAVFNNGRDNKAYCTDVFSLNTSADLVYLDPPYYTPHSDNDYLRRYHFVEGVCRRWEGVEILYRTKTHKLRKIPTPFDVKRQVYAAFQELIAKFRHSTIVMSYSSNGIPTHTELMALLQEQGKQVEVITVPHHYSFGTHTHIQHNSRNVVSEYFLVAR